MGRLLLGEIKRIHFIGIGGYGMSALALVLLELGYYVSGSDKKQSAITEKLSKRGAVVFPYHSEENIKGAELVVYSTAIPDDNEEIVAAKKIGVPVWHRSELLARFINRHYGIAVAGTHGKTTTTSMLAAVLIQGKLDPTAFIGGVLADFGGNARAGKSEIVLAEACESDNSFLRYRPRMAVITNVEADHLEHYRGSFALLLQAYEKFLHNIVPGGTAVLSAEDHNLGKIKMPQAVKTVTFGLQKGDWRAENIRLHNWGSSFLAAGPSGRLGEIHLSVPGKFNVLNALAAVAVAWELQIAFADIQAGLAGFKGAERRFQFLFRYKDIMVVDDYAHHPTEVRATLQAARSGPVRRVIVVFQPHRYSRTKWFLDDFPEAFAAADKVILTNIYAASEQPLAGVSSRELADRMRKRGIDVTEIDDVEEIIRYALPLLQPGDLLITMGAGDVTEIGHRLANCLKAKYL